MNNTEKQEMFDKLVAEGMMAADALQYIALQAATDDDVETISDLSAQLRDNGYSADEMSRLIMYKIENKEKIDSIRQVVRIGRMIPISEIHGWYGMSESDKEYTLHTLGFDVDNFQYVVDVGCFRYNTNHIVCGEYVYGSERTDKAWLNLVIEGRNVASEEARYHDSREVLEVLRGNKKA